MKQKLFYTLKAWLVITTATLLVCFLTEQVGAWLGFDLKDQTNLELVKALAGWNWRFVFVIAQVVLLMPALEEFIFRYLLFKLPCRFKSLWSRSPSQMMGAALPSALLFSAAHYLQAPFPDNAFLALFFFGFAQCGLYKKTDNILCPMLNHALFNATNLILLFIIST